MRFPAGFDVIAIDASFISLRTIVARAIAYLRAGGTMLALVKPQFEAGRERLGSGGVVRDPAVHAAILREVRAALDALGRARGATPACRRCAVRPATSSSSTASTRDGRADRRRADRRAGR